MSTGPAVDSVDHPRVCCRRRFFATSRRACSRSASIARTSKARRGIGDNSRSHEPRAICRHCSTITTGRATSSSMRVTDVPREKFTQPVEAASSRCATRSRNLRRRSRVVFALAGRVADWVDRLPTHFPSAASIRRAWEDLEAKCARSSTASAKRRSTSVFDYTLLSGAPDTAPFWQMLVHVVNHGPITADR